MENFTLAQDVVGNILLEDGKGRCPFDPNFKSTALVVGECWGSGGQDGLIEAPREGGQGSRVGPRSELVGPCHTDSQRVRRPWAALGLAFLSSYSLLCPPQTRRAALVSLRALSGKGLC